MYVIVLSTISSYGNGVCSINISNWWRCILDYSTILMNLFILSYFDVDVGTADSLWSGWTKDNFAISGRLNITRDIGQEGRERNGVNLLCDQSDRSTSTDVDNYLHLFFCKLCSFKLKIYLSIFSRFMSKTQLIYTLFFFSLYFLLFYFPVLFFLFFYYLFFVFHLFFIILSSVFFSVL